MHGQLYLSKKVIMDVAIRPIHAWLMDFKKPNPVCPECVFTPFSPNMNSETHCNGRTREWSISEFVADESEFSCELSMHFLELISKTQPNCTKCSPNSPTFPFQEMQYPMWISHATMNNQNPQSWTTLATQQYQFINLLGKSCHGTAGNCSRFIQNPN